MLNTNIYIVKQIYLSNKLGNTSTIKIMRNLFNFHDQKTSNNFTWNKYYTYKILYNEGAVVAMIVWQLDLQLSMKSVPITTDVVSSNLDQGEVYNIM